jgi:hypothetical protein
MTVAWIASHESEVHAGYLAATFAIPVIGLVCLVIGLVRRGRPRPAPPPFYPGYPPPAGPATPAGYSYPPPPPVGYPGPYPGTTYPGYPPGLPPRRRTRQSGTALIIIGALLLTLGGIGILGNLARVVGEQATRPHGNSLLPTDTSMGVGECISQIEFLGRLFGSQRADSCANEFDTYELAFKGGPGATCPDGKVDHSVYDRYSDESTMLCFALNLKQGQCYRLDHDGDDLTMSLSDCGQPRPMQVRVAQRIDGSTDKAQCPPGSKAISYPTPPRVYCLVKADS